GVLDVLPVQGVEHDVPFELDLMLIRHVLELTAPALGDEGAGRRDSVRRRLNDSYDLSERRRALAVPDRNLDLFTGDATLDYHRGAQVVVGQTQPPMDHASETHRATAPRAVRAEDGSPRACRPCHRSRP